MFPSAAALSYVVAAIQPHRCGAAAMHPFKVLYSVDCVGSFRTTNRSTVRGNESCTTAPQYYTFIVERQRNENTFDSPAESSVAPPADGGSFGYTTRPPEEGSKLASSGVTQKLRFTEATSACTLMPSKLRYTAV